MFIRLENHIININEIRNIEMATHDRNKGTVHVHFGDGTGNWISFKTRPIEECQQILSIFEEACIGKKEREVHNNVKS